MPGQRWLRAGAAMAARWGTDACARIEGWGSVVGTASAVGDTMRCLPSIRRTLVNSRVARQVMALVSTILLLLPAPPVVHAQAAAPSGSAEQLAEGSWPRQLEINGATVLIYQPQLDKWQGNRLEGRAAVEIHRPGAPAPSYGVIWITARTEVDKERGIVTLEDIKIPQVSFP